MSTSYEPFYVLNLEIPKGVEDLQECLNSYFHEKRIHDYMFKGRRTRATHRQLIDRLPNVLCLHLKRFIYTDKLVKLRDHVWFEEVLTVSDNLVSAGLRVGIFNEKHEGKAMQAAQYRLFSAVEHIGDYAHRGHYVSHTMDSGDNWRCFDDERVKARTLDTVLDTTQAYILFYELI